MVKKVLALTFGLLLFMGAMAQTPKTATIAASDVHYWVGSGSNQAVVLITWEELDDNDDEYYVGAVWGVRFNGTILCNSLMDTLSAYDANLNISMNAGRSFINDMTYSNTQTGLVLNGSGGWWMYNVNGVMASAINNQQITNGDFIEWSDMGQFDADTIIFLEDPNAPTTPTEATIAFSEILYWVGTGSNEAVLAVNWADTCLAWGYRWNGTATVTTMMAAIANDDPRFDYSSTGMLNDITFNDGTVSLAGTPGNWWGSTNNGVMDAGMGQTLSDGDFEKWGDPAAGVVVDSMEYSGYWYYTYAYPMTVHPVSVPGPAPVVEATIDASAIEYWVGEGSNSAILAVNWADTALAWGYRWNGDATVATMMDDIANDDPRFSYSMNGSYLGDILFVVAAGDTLRGTSWWESSLYNGMAQVLADGDFEKWADPAAGVIVDSMEYSGYWYYTYAYPMTIHAVTQPLGAGPFDGIVGTPGCAAIPATSSAILGWATGCTVERGPQNISVEGSPLASYHTAQDAIGPCDTSDNLSVVSLGDGGSATLTFAHPIMNGEGPDFAVFENAFDSYFLELAFVEVSSDGQRFVRFPATSLTQTVHQIGGTGRLDATYINNLAGKYRMGYGTPFDLAELADSTGLDINNITHVRVVDVVGSINPLYATYDAFGHMVNDPWPTNSNGSGFDLDGVAVLHSTSEGIDDVDDEMVSVYPNPATDFITISGATGAKAEICDVMGRRVMAFTVESSNFTVNVASLPAGVYLLRVDGTVCRIVK